MKDKKPEGRTVLKPAGTARKKGSLVHSKRALAASAKPRVVGKPFMPGPDPRRHRLGRASLDRAAFSAKLNNFLCNGIGDPEALARILWKYAMAGQAWAVTELLNRICGKVAQAVQLEESVRKFIIMYADEALEPAAADPRAERELSLSRKIEGQDGR